MPAPYAASAAFVRALAFFALMAAALSAQASEITTPAQLLTGQASRAVPSDSAVRLRWDMPGGSWSARGEVAPIAPDAEGEGGGYRGLMTLGGRHQLIASPGFTWALVPELRVEAMGGSQGAVAAPAIGASLLQEAALSLPGGACFSAVLGIGDPVGLSAPLGTGGAHASLALRANASVAGVVGSVARMPLRAELQVATARTVTADRWAEQPSSCELKLEFSRAGRLPLRIAGSCPGDHDPRLTIGISGRF